jgi:hypothetical protein
MAGRVVARSMLLVGGHGSDWKEKGGRASEMMDNNIVFLDLGSG